MCAGERWEIKNLKLKEAILLSIKSLPALSSRLTRAALESLNGTWPLYGAPAPIDQLRGSSAEDLEAN